MASNSFRSAGRFLFSTLFITSIYAAPTPKQIHIEHAPGLWNLTNSSRIIRSDGASLKTNTFGVADITTLVEERPVALAHARTAARQNNIASIWFWCTVPVGFLARIATYPLVESEVISTKTGWIIFGSGITLSLVGALVSLHYFNNAKFSMYLAIKEYNHPTSAETGAAAYFGGVSFRVQ